MEEKDRKILVEMIFLGMIIRKSGYLLLIQFLVNKEVAKV